MLSPHEVHALLSKLCVNLGFCLDGEAQTALTTCPPADVKSFTDAVFVAEGLEPTQADRHLYRQVKAVVAEAFRTRSNREVIAFPVTDLVAGWSFDCVELSAGVYCVSGLGPTGQSIAMTGVDPEALLADCAEAIRHESLPPSHLLRR
jgi:hypothetical protein